MKNLNRPSALGLALVSFATAAALVSAGCIPPSPNPQPGCASGTGTLAFQNNSGEAVQVDLSDEAGPLPSIALAAGQTLDELDPTGTYTISATGTASHRVLLDKQAFTVSCDSKTPVVINAEPPLTLSVGITGSGSGSVSSAPAGIQCSSSVCTAPFQPAAQVVLTAQAQGASTFKGWGGACSGTATTCNVTMSQAQSVTAQFDAPQTSPHLNYYGGPVVRNPRLVMVTWGTSVDSTTVANLPAFLASVPASPAFVSIVSQYTDGNGIGVHASTYVGKYTLSNLPATSRVTDDQIQATLMAAITAGQLPANEADTIYLVTMPAGFAVTLAGSTSCQQFCSYHGTIGAALGNGSAIPYIVLPDVGHDGCQLGCGSAATMFDNLTAQASKQLAAAMTDPDVGLASSYGPPLGWYDPQGSNGEIGDICNGQQGTISVNGSSWTVSKLWSNADNACEVARPASVAMLSGAPSSQSVAAGGTATTYTITATGTGSQSLALVATGLPAGITATLSPSSIAPGGSSTLTVQAAASVAAGNYLFSVQGTFGTSTVSTGPFGLTVTAAH